MSPCGSLFCALGIAVLSTLTTAVPSTAATIPLVESTLNEAQKALLRAALEVKPDQTYGQIITQALAEGMACEEVVAFLCADAGKAPKAVENQKRIVFAAIDAAKCGPGKVVTRALQAGAPLDSVIHAALRAGVSREVIAAAAWDAGYAPDVIAMVFTILLAGGGTGGAGSTGPQGGGTGGPPLIEPPPPPVVPPPASPSTP